MYKDGDATILIGRWTIDGDGGVQDVAEKYYHRFPMRECTYAYGSWYRTSGRCAPWHCETFSSRPVVR